MASEMASALLETESEMNAADHAITLIQPTELIGYENNGWETPTSQIGQTSGFTMKFIQITHQLGGNDAGIFSQSDSEMLEQLGEDSQVPAELIMKSIRRNAAGGLGQRRGI